MNLPRPSSFVGWTVFLLTIPIGLYYSMLLFGMAFHSSPSEERAAEFIFAVLTVLNPVGIVAALALKAADPSLLSSLRAFWIGALISPMVWAYFAGWVRSRGNR